MVNFTCQGPASIPRINTCRGMASMLVILLQLQTLMLLVAATAYSNLWLQTNTSLPNCPDKCGNVSIPYPFGIGPERSMKGFEIDCKRSTPFLGTSDFEIINISLPLGQIRVYMRTHVISNQFNSSYVLSYNFLDGNVRRVPVSLDWAVGAADNCETAMLNTSSYKCLSQRSNCFDASNGPGYLCQCSTGHQGNPYLANGCQGTMTTSVGMMSFAIGIFLFLIVYGQLWMCMKWRSARRKRLYFYRNRGLLLQQLISSDETLVERMKIFNLAELEKATNKFDSSRIIGRGGHGSVYKGILSDQRIVAVKKSKITDQREIDQFINEVVILSQINHRNIVKLFGCCLESEVPLLVYEFISGGTLLNHLRGSRRFLSFSFDDRLRVAIDIAGALSYLHSAASISIFHRDVKSSNILLDENWAVKVSDFGASRTIPFNRTSITTTVQGTYGYLDPEYYMTEKLTQKSDVYSFGVILAELLIGQDVFSYKKNYQHRGLVVDFICSLRENALFDKLDPHVVEDGASEEVEMVAKVAEMCLKPRGEERPTMKEVEQKLDAVRRLKKLKDDAMVLQNRVVGTASAAQIGLSDLLRQHSLVEQFMFSLSEQSR